MNGEHGSPRPEPGIGRSLQKAREERGLTLQQVEQRTKIRARYLQGLEREDFGVLPTVYVLGSLKTYADHLGLDGAGLSRQLRTRLEQPTEPDLSAQLAALRETRDEDDEYEAAPITAAGFDQLFLGMGAIVISTLAVMTLVFVLATAEQPAVSQIREPSTPEMPSEIALAGNVLDKLGRQPRDERAPAGTENDKDGRSADEKAGQPKNESGPSKNDKDRPEQQPEDASSQEPLFDNVKFVPMSPSSPPATGTASSAASASPQPTAPTPVPSSSASSSSAPASPASEGSTTTTDAPAPEAVSSGATPGPATAEPAPTATQPASTTTQPAPATTGAPNLPVPRGARSGDLDASRLVDEINAQVEDAVGPMRR